MNKQDKIVASHIRAARLDREANERSEMGAMNRAEELAKQATQIRNREVTMDRK